MSDLFNALFRRLQSYPFDPRLENITLCTELSDLKSLYWKISQGKLQAVSAPQSWSLKISGTLPQWMELLYNPLQPVNGCQIQGDPHLFQVLKENLQNLSQFYHSSWAKKIYLRSVLYQMQRMVQTSSTSLPWASNDDLESLRGHFRKAYQRLDRLQWALKPQGKLS